MPQSGAKARLVHNEVWVKLHTNDPGVVDAVYRLLRFRPAGYNFMPKYRNGTWDGYISLYQRRGATFPGGLMARAVTRLQELGVAVDIEDRSQSPMTEPELAGGTSNIELRPYQIEACDRAMVAKRGVFDAATGTGKCLAPETLVLTADLQWVPVSDLVQGDVLVGFDEYPNRGFGSAGSPRRFRPSTVLSAGRANLPCYEILLATGERLIATGEHQWLIERPSSSVRWATTESLYWSQQHRVRKRPIRLARYVDVWESTTTEDGHYLRGLYDGEGSIRKRPEYGGSFNGVSFSQKNEIVLKEARAALHQEGFLFKERVASRGVSNLELATRDGMRLLGQIRPRRLLGKWANLKWPRLTSRDWVQVVGIQPVGSHEVVTLTTSTKTFLAEGFGSHNTEIMGEMIRRLGCRSLIIVASRDLAWQTIRRFQGTEREAARLTFPNANQDHLYGIVGDDVDSPGLVTAALYQTLVRRLDEEPEETREWLASFDALHLDECHRASAKTWWPVVNAIPAYWRFGYSATPFKSDPITELKLVGATGEIFYSFKAKEAVKEGWLTEPFVITVDPNFPALHDEERYIDSYRDGIVEHVKRNRLIAEIAQGTSEQWGVPTLILVQWIEHGRNIQRALREIEVRAEFISGQASTEERLATMDALRDGRIKCVISTTIFDEGVNVPEIGALILAGGGRAHHKVIQRIGRGLRVVEGKEYLAVFDIWDAHSDKYLIGHSRQRLRAVKDAGFTQETLTPKELLDRIALGDIRH